MLEVESDDPQEKERRWEDFWDALDFVGLQLEAPQTSFSAVFEKLLPIRERLALPGATARTRITGGDATLDRIGEVDWAAKIFHASTVGRYTRRPFALRRTKGMRPRLSPSWNCSRSSCLPATVAASQLDLISHGAPPPQVEPTSAGGRAK